MLVVTSAKTIVQLSHLTSKMTASQRCIYVLQISIDAPHSFIGDGGNVLEEVELQLP